MRAIGKAVEIVLAVCACWSRPCNYCFIWPFKYYMLCYTMLHVAYYFWRILCHTMHYVVRCIVLCVVCFILCCMSLFFTYSVVYATRAWWKCSDTESSHSFCSVLITCSSKLQWNLTNNRKSSFRPAIVRRIIFISWREQKIIYSFFQVHKT